MALQVKRCNDGLFGSLLSPAWLVSMPGPRWPGRIDATMVCSVVCIHLAILRADIVWLTARGCVAWDNMFKINIIVTFILCKYILIALNLPNFVLIIMKNTNIIQYKLIICLIPSLVKAYTHPASQALQKRTPFTFLGSQTRWCVLHAPSQVGDRVQATKLSKLHPSGLAQPSCRQPNESSHYS